MNAIVNGRILLPDGEAQHKTLLFDRVILGLCEQPPRDCRVFDAGGLYVAPGLVDAHIHGFLGEDASDGSPAGLRRMAKALLQNGVTAFLPTTMTVPFSQLEAAFGAIRGLMAESASPAFDGAQIAGCHAEGPFINPARKGAQAEGAILPPDAELLLPWADVIRLVTLAPEMPGAIACIRALRRAGIRVSVGHTDADFDTALAALDAGADHFTHVFNAMSGLHHRRPGAVGAALVSDACCELIADTFHVDKGLFPLLRRAKGEQLALITDCTRAGGLADGEYDLGGQTIHVRGPECRLADGTIAGSVLRLNEAVRNYRDHSGAPLWEAVRCASQAPARSIGIDRKKGALLPGLDADILLMDEGCAVHAVWRSGERKL